MSVTATRRSQDPYPVGDDRRQDPEGTRVCTFPGHEGENPLPATPELWPVRKSGAREGTFIGWCSACQKLNGQRHKEEPHRHGTRPRASSLPPVLAEATVVRQDAVRNYSACR